MAWKLFVLFVFAGLLHASEAEGQRQSFDFRLKMADSLFYQKKYTESLELYKQIFDQKAYTPAMLLKMAYVEEGLGQTAMSLYYLNIYYRLTRDERALEKMEETATAFQLKGYEITPLDRFLMFLTIYRFPAIGFLALGTLLFGISAFRQQGKDMQWFVVVVQFVFAAALLFLINIDLRQDAGIISKSPVYVMSGPSSGSKVVAIIGDGHRLDVEDTEDVWVKVLWEGREGWVKESALLRL
jgi:hypothetical protein